MHIKINEVIETRQSMALDPSIRDLLDQSLDQIIKNPPQHITVFRTETAKEALHLRSASGSDDFALGMILGHVLGAFQVSYYRNFNRVLTAQELSEVAKVLLDKSGQLRDAVIGLTGLG
jgi:hypothetical protein